jgi:hypothetical protein
MLTDKQKGRVQIDQLDVSHKDSIDALQKEIKCIQGVLAEQRALMGALTVPNTSAKIEMPWESHQFNSTEDHSAGTDSKPGSVEAVNETNDTIKSYSDSRDYRQFLQIPQNSHISLSRSFSEDCRELLDHAAKGFDQLMFQARTLEEMVRQEAIHTCS